MSKSKQGRLVPFEFPSTFIPKRKRTLKEVIGGWKKLQFRNIFPDSVEWFPGANILGVVVGDLSGDWLLVEEGGKQKVYPRGDCRAILKRRGLRLAGQTEKKVVGSVRFVSACLDSSICAFCQLCDKPLTGTTDRKEKNERR